MLLAQLEKYLAEIKLSISVKQQQQLIDFVKLIAKWNKAYNLTAVKNTDQMLIRHVMDSLVVNKYLEGDSFIDVGSGAGLPGVPLAIINPDKKFVLLDSLGKRILFQKQLQFELGIDNITSVKSRVESYLPEQKFNGVLSRAFASIKDMLLCCQHLVADKGHFYALKGRLNDGEMTELPDGFMISEVFTLQVPCLDEQRHLLKLTKSKEIDR